MYISRFGTTGFLPRSHVPFRSTWAPAVLRLEQRSEGTRFVFRPPATHLGKCDDVLLINPGMSIEYRLVSLVPI